VLEIIRRNTGTGVGDAEFDPVGAMACGEVHRSAGAGELERVPDKIGEDLQDTRGVSANGR
jgi:hypothetical protein